MFQGGSMEPLQAMVLEIRNNQFFTLWIIDDGPRILELTSHIFFLAYGATQERLENTNLHDWVATRLQINMVQHTEWNGVHAMV